MHTRRFILFSTIASAALIFGMAPIAFSGEVEDAPLPTCARSPRAASQGDDVTVNGSDWEPDSTVTIAFDGDDDLFTTDDTTSGTLDDDTTENTLDDDDTTEDTLDDDSDDDSDAVTAEVDEDGEFEIDITIPETAVRGSHSINVSGTDEDGVAASCARTVRVPDSLEDTTDTTTDDTTATTRDDDDGQTPGSTGSTPSSTTATTSSTTP